MRGWGLIVIFLIPCAIFGCPEMGDIDPGSATAAYVRLVKKLAERPERLSPEALEEIVASEKALNPVETGLVTLSEIVAIGYRRAFKIQLTRGVDWAEARRSLRAILDHAKKSEGEREVARQETAGIVSPRVLVADVIQASGLPRPAGTVSPKAIAGGDGALYILLNAESGRQSVVRYENGKSSVVTLPNESVHRSLLRARDGSIQVACLVLDPRERTTRLALVDARTGATRTAPVSQSLARTGGSRERFPKMGESFPEFYLLEGNDGGTSVVAWWQEDFTSRSEVVLFGGARPQLAPPPKGKEIELFSPSNRATLYARAVEGNGELVVKDLMTGREVLRERYERRPHATDSGWMTEDAKGSPRVAWVDKSGTWFERDLASGARREIPLGRVPREAAGYVQGPRGPVFLFEHMLPRHGRELTVIADGAGTAETRTGVVVNTRKPVAFTTSSGGHLAVGQDGNMNGHESALQIADLHTGEMRRYPLPRGPKYQLAELHQLSAGQAVAMLYLQGEDGPKSVALVQVYGAVPP